MPNPIPWWADPRIRTQIGMYLPGILLYLKHHSSLDLTPFADTITDLLLLGISVVAGVIGLLKRIKDGKDPANPEPPIATPAPVKAVQRLTK